MQIRLLLKNRKWIFNCLMLVVAVNSGVWASMAETVIEPPLVYKVEDTGASFSKPDLPNIDVLPSIPTLTDPFAWSNGSGRSTEFSDWKKRRAEIKAEIEHYEIGQKPGKPGKLEAHYENGKLKVVVMENGESLELSARVELPEGEGPFPAVIGIGFGIGTGSLPPEIFTKKRIARISFNFSQVMSHTQKRGNEPFNKLYPELVHIGAYSAWSWGVSRIIDGLEQVQSDIPIDHRRLAITGCSFAGKMALFAGAFDERIALTIAQEPGGGGAAAWRVSETLGNVEKLGATSRAWFMESMFQFSGSNVSKLPMDHHELMTMVAPRALLVLGNPDYGWLAEESGYVSCRAAHQVWKAFGIGDRFGFSIVSDHPHCRLPDSQIPEVEAFVDKFLLGDQSANTLVTTHPYQSVNHKMWYEWWGKGKPEFSGAKDAYTIALEAECGDLGSNWISSYERSSVTYITPNTGVQSIESAPLSSDDQVRIPFKLDKPGSYTLFARLNCPSADDDSLWLKFNDSEFVRMNGLGTNGWQWISLGKFKLSKGTNHISIGLREDGLKLDKLCLSTFFMPPSQLGPEAQNKCQ